MADIYFASDNTLAGRNGSLSNPYRDPSELGSAWAVAHGNAYWFRADCPDWNFAAAFCNASYNAGAVSFGAYGSGTKRPRISMYRLVDRSEFTEVAIQSYTPGNKNSIVTTPQAGTNLWAGPKQILGLYGTVAKVWGVACDITGGEGNGPEHTPSAWGEYAANADTGGKRIVYSIGNPVDYYGAVYANPVNDTDYGLAYKNVAIGSFQTRGGWAVDGLDFDTLNCPSNLTCGALSPGLKTLNNVSYTNCRVWNAYRGGLTLSGNGVMDSGIGYRKVRITDNYAENIARTFVETLQGACLNDTRIARNVVNGYGKSYSSGGIYLGGNYTDDGSRILVERNCGSGGDAFHIWISDGYWLYSENATKKIEFRQNVGWNNVLNAVCNVSGDEVVWRQNVLFAKPDVPDSYNRAFVVSGANADKRVLYAGNVGIGFRRFVFGTGVGANGVVTVRGNVSRCDKSSSGANAADNTNAIRAGGHDTTKLVVDGNAFFGHDAQIYDTANTTAYNGAPNVTNAIAGDPASELARLPIPTDPTVNYALQISPNFWAGAVDLRAGAIRSGW